MLYLLHADFADFADVSQYPRVVRKICEIQGVQEICDICAICVGIKSNWVCASIQHQSPELHLFFPPRNLLVSNTLAIFVID